MEGALQQQTFREHVERAVTAAADVLGSELRVQPAEHVPHGYDNTFSLAEVLTCLSLGAWVNVIEALGLNKPRLVQLAEWSRRQSVTVRFKAEERCSFVKELKREVEDKAHGFVSTVTEFLWRLHVEYELSAHAGTGEKERIVLQSRCCKYDLITLSKDLAPRKHMVRDALDVNVTWALNQLEVGEIVFGIDRSAKSCKTPRRNEDVIRAMEFFEAFDQWSRSVSQYFESSVFPFEKNHNLDLRSIHDESVFVPVLPLFIVHDGRRRETEGSPCSAIVRLKESRSGVTLSAPDLNRLLDEEKRTLAEKMAELAKVLPEPGKLIGAAEGRLLVCMRHVRRMAYYFKSGVDYIEEMLQNRIVAAVGKELTAEDFARYMVHHNRLTFREEYQPKPFAYAIRRPDHSPEGVISLETQPKDESIAEPVQTLVARSELGLQMSLDVGTRLRIGGELLVHGLLMHQFGDEPAPSMSLNLRARQVSSFLVLVGRVTGPEVFEPAYGIIVQNKDEVVIPLEMNAIPSAGEFKAATISVSPEQHAFAKMYRGMQLGSTLFGVCVIQIKPQLERVLKLVDRSLTQEIRLTQNLMQMLIEHQIPPDLLSSSGSQRRLESVKRNVKRMQLVVAGAKIRDLLEKLDAARKARISGLPVVSPLELVSQERRVGVQLLDGTIEMVSLDESRSVEVLCELIGLKVGVESMADYGLQIARTNCWLDNGQTLLEQGVKDDTLLRFKKQLFDDEEVDKSDPDALQLLYVQCRDAVLSGQYPLETIEAVRFAALQLQAEVGNYDTQMTRESLRFDFVPIAHRKVVQWNDIVGQWEKFANLDKINAQYRYVQTCRQLATYGITTFEVLEKQDQKKKKQKVLLGVTRDAVMRLNPVTREVIKSYPLEHMRRWATNEGTFTLDFGMYEKDYYTVETSRGEEISQLLCGYIDILLKRRGDGASCFSDGKVDAERGEEIVESVLRTITLGMDDADEKSPTASTNVRDAKGTDSQVPSKDTPSAVSSRLTSTSRSSSKKIIPRSETEKQRAAAPAGPLTVKLMDGTVKTLVASKGASISELMGTIGAKIGLDNTEEYGIKVGDKWLDQNRPLEEQGIHDLSQVEFKKRFFCDDLNVDKSDPIQLHLLYLQCRDAILSGDNPVNREEAVLFAANQLQVEKGNYVREIKGNFEELLPVYLRGKIEWNDVARQWQKLVNVRSDNARYRYVQSCRQLPTYGITTYQVRERRFGAHGLVPALLGVTRDAVLRMDPVTREVIKSYPLEHVRRWAADDSTFTLDFGTHEKNYYAVETNRGEEISQLLSGYVDILLKHKRSYSLWKSDDFDVAEVEEIGPLTAVPNVATVTDTGENSGVSEALIKKMRENTRDRLVRQLAKIEEINASLEAEEKDAAFDAPPVEVGGPIFRGMRDVTLIPNALDAALEKLDPDGALRPMIVNVGKEWVRHRQAGLAGPVQKTVLTGEQQRLEKQRCCDLLDALTKSGSIAINGAALHVVIATSHSFEKSLMNTLVLDNVCPITKVEQSQLILAKHIFGTEGPFLV